MLNIQRFVFNPYQENTYVVSDDTGECVIIDCGAFFDDERMAIVEYINDTIFANYGLSPEIHQADSFLLNSLDRQTESYLGFQVEPSVPKAVRFIDKNDVINFGSHSFKVLETPGHTPGGLTFFCEEEKVAFTGDTLFQMSIGRTDFEEGDDEAMDDYINNLQLEKALEDASIEMQADNTGYVPEVYPYVIRDLGMGLVVTGKMNEAQEMFSDMVNGVYGLTGDALYANFVGTQYAAQLYILDSKPDWALATWDNFKDYLKENESDYDPEDLAQCLAQIEYEMNRLQGKETNTDD